DLFDYKPGLKKFHKTELPDSIRRGQRLTGMTSGQKSFPIAASMYRFAQHGHSGTWVSELLPQTAKIADELCVVKSMYTEAINHDPAITFLQTGSIQAGRPSMGSWI
ncbi:MAG TPA: sulfatase, partial [Planctomycetaceae bacterium]|nr:sulfatase [Planctomycetaceae bacterium]